MQPGNPDKLYPSPNISGGVNSIYLPEVARTPNTGIYLRSVQRTSGPFYIKDNTAN